MRCLIVMTIMAGLLLTGMRAGAEGARPYEMDRAGRTADTRPPLIDFEQLDGWTVQCKDAAATFKPAGDQRLWGAQVAELTYRGMGGSRPVVTIRPPRPVPMPAGSDCVNVWVYGNNWAWASEKSTPPVEIALVFQGLKGQAIRVVMGTVRWKEWWLMHRKLTSEQLAALGPAAALAAIEVSGGRNREDRKLYFDNLVAYRETLKPLTFEPRPQRNLTLAEGQSAGTNTGPGRLPFPTREETILPDNLAAGFKVELKEIPGGYEFHYRGPDGHLVYTYKPSSGTLGDLTAHWEGRGGAFQPLAGGGIALAADPAGKAAEPERIEPVACRREGDQVLSAWRCRLGNQTAEVTYRFQLWQKSLIVDVACPGGQAGEFRVGRAVGAAQPRLVTLPYLTGDAQRPAVLVMGPAARPLFAMALLDYYRSNASELWAENRISADGAWANGGARYLSKTDGRRNDCFERLFLTVSPRFEEVLPNIPNPKSPWMEVAGERLWRAHGASDRERDYAQWKKVARYGMTKVVITDHETGWRDGGESFTFRTEAAPGKGGDAAQADYARKLHALGFRYGIYNNYTDFAPVNAHWDEDMVTRLPDGEWKTAWARCYNPKPARAVEYEAKLAPVIQEKFKLDTAYCDVHTAVRPWQYCDYDARVPGAGTFAATFYAYGEIMLHQKKTWGGPVYSEGNNHWYYCGLTDGNYGQDQLAQLDERPWLVDFDLRKLHPLCCNFGMGNLGMFYGKQEGLGATPAEREARLDRFLAATLAFGHTGFLVMEGGMENTVRSYFNLQQVHAHYARETAAEIKYGDGKGGLLGVSEAVASGAFERSQVLTRYANGLTVAVNGHMRENWEIEGMRLPPNGWIARGDTKNGPLTAFSALLDGRRADYVDSPDYIYADGRGRLTRFAKAVCDGQLIAHRRAGGIFEVIPVGRCTEFGVALEGGRAATAEALDEEGKPLGPAQTRFSRGIVTILPLKGAFSYLLKPAAPPEVALACSRVEAVPGEAVKIAGREEHPFQVPAATRPGARLWQSFEGAWIDFSVVPLLDSKLVLEGAHLKLALTPHLAAPTSATVTLAGRTHALTLKPGSTAQLEAGFPAALTEGARPVRLEVNAGGLAYSRSWRLVSEKKIINLLDIPVEIETGQRLRGRKDEPLTAASKAAVVWTEKSCGEEARKTLFMHPPYGGGTGYAYALTAPLQIPEQPSRFACDVGKADGSDPGDGILFRVAVVEPGGAETILAEKAWIRHAWTGLAGSLAPWAGKTVRLKLIADVGPKNNSSGDWACWSELRIESDGAVLTTRVED